MLNGSEPGDSARAGTKPDLTYVGVPIGPASPDVTPQATEVLDFDPDVIIYSAQGADCWNFVDAMGRLGWTPEDTPLVLSGACTDFAAQAAAGPLAEGVYFIGSGNTLLSPLDEQEPGKNLDDATVYQTKAAEYGLSEDDLFKGFSTQGFSMIMNVWEAANAIDGEVTGTAIEAALAATDGTTPTFGGLPAELCGGTRAVRGGVQLRRQCQRRGTARSSSPSCQSSAASTWLREPSSARAADRSDTKRNRRHRRPRRRLIHHHRSGRSVQRALRPDRVRGQIVGDARES